MLTNNDVLRRLRYALDLSDTGVVAVFELAGVSTSPDRVRALMAREGEPGREPCPDGLLSDFLDGLIVERRGPRPAGAPVPPASRTCDNNEVLKKLRIALQLRDHDVIAALAAGGMTVSKAEITALFRRPHHKHYRAAGDQLLRKFLVGLTAHLKPQAQPTTVASPRSD